METRHTPGPWRREVSGRSVSVFAGKQNLAYLGSRAKNREADGALMAASLDLLKALTTARECLHDIANAKEGERWNWDWEQVLSDADTAIAKATEAP